MTQDSFSRAVNQMLDQVAAKPRPHHRKQILRKEADVLQDVLGYLKRRGVLHWRQNVGGASYGGRRVFFGRIGLADILGVLPGGTFLAVECKRPGRDTTAARRRDRQDRFGRQVMEAGGVYLVARSVDDVRPVIESYLTGEDRGDRHDHT